MSHWALENLPQGWFNHAERTLALLEEVRPLRCVELGTWRGASAIAMARVLRKWGGRLICIDTFAAGPDGPPVMLDECVANLRRAGVSDVVDVIVGRSAEVGSAWADGPVAFCYVDADHTFESVTADLAAWWPRVRLGGIIAGDDYQNPPYDGCTKAWDQFDRQVGGLRRDGLVWAVKGDSAPYVPIEETVMEETVCAICHRVVFLAHVDDEGCCCYCATPPAQRSDVARPAAELPRTPRREDRKRED